MIAQNANPCNRPLCDGYQQETPEHVHKITLSSNVCIMFLADERWAVRVEATLLSHPQALRKISDEISRAAGIVEDLNRFTSTQVIADSVRGCIAVYRGRGSTILRDVLEVSTLRARKLFAGRADYTPDELLLLGAYFNVPVRDFHLGTAFPKYVAGQRDEAARTAGYDRVVTLREERRDLVAA